MSLYRAEALVLRVRDLGEADRILTLYTRSEGKLQAVARGSRRPRSRLLGATQPFCHARYLLMSGRELDSIQQAELLSHGLRALREDLRRMAAASVTAELVDLLVETREPSEALFSALLNTWSQLASAPEAALHQVLSWFEVHLMDLMGYAPVLDGCAGCGRELQAAETVRFSAREGGSLCAACAVRRDPRAPLLKPEARAALHHLREHGTEACLRLKSSREAALQIRRALYDFIEFRLPAPSKAWHFWNSLDGPPPVPGAGPGDTEGSVNGLGGRAAQDRPDPGTDRARLPAGPRPAG
ncbi:MAG: DNA repair protein RecO [Bacillota bacterium]